MLCEGAESKTKTQSSSDALFNASETQHHLTQQQATLHSKWHELAQEDRSSSASRDASITPNRERDQDPFTLTLRRRRQRLCEGRTGRAIIVTTIASRRREASIVYVQQTDGSGEARKIHSATQRLGALKEDEAMRLRGIQVPMQSPRMSGKEPVDEEKANKEIFKPATPSEPRAGRREGHQPITPWVGG